MYRKEFPFRNGRGNNNRCKPGSSKHLRKGKQGDDPGEHVANIALMSKSMLRGEVSLPPTMKENWFVDSA